MQGLFHWLYGQVWPNIFASMLSFSAAFFVAHRRVIRPIHRKLDHLIGGTHGNPDVPGVRQGIPGKEQR